MEGFVTASSATDIYYFLRKLAGHIKALENLKELFESIEIIEVGKSEIFHALRLDMPDFEDALIVTCAKRAKADYIVTRDKKGFKNSAVKALTPEEFLGRHFPYAE
jgi:predicted nucleic acid-binding protein